MSYSTLIGINKEFKIGSEKEYKNSWLFCPIIWNELFWKYLPEEKLSDFGDKKSFVLANMFDKTVSSRINEKINNCDCFNDRIMWELSNIQVFSKKDKELISKSIINFVESLKDKYQDHITGRMKEIAADILKIEDQYFVFKPTSCDDNVEYWFRKYDEETDEYKEISILENDKFVCEFVDIKGEKIEFYTNLDWKKLGEWPNEKTKKI